MAAVFSRAHIHLYTGDGRSALDHMNRSWPALQRALQLRSQIIRIMMLDLRARVSLAAARDASDAPRLIARARRDAQVAPQESEAPPRGLRVRAFMYRQPGSRGRSAVHRRETAVWRPTMSASCSRCCPKEDKGSPPVPGQRRITDKVRPQFSEGGSAESTTRTSTALSWIPASTRAVPAVR
jgi:hypothetical protein